MNFKILLLKILKLLDFLIYGPRLFPSFIVEGKKEFLKKSCFVRSWGILSEFPEIFLVLSEGTSWKRYLGDWLLIILKLREVTYLTVSTIRIITVWIRWFIKIFFYRNGPCVFFNKILQLLKTPTVLRYWFKVTVI